MVDGFFCILDFPKFSEGGPRTPPIKGIHQLNPHNLSSTTAAEDKKKKKKKEPESPPPLKQSTRNLSLGYTVIQKLKKGGGHWGKIFLMWFVIGLFETLICAIYKQKMLHCQFLSIAYVFTLSVTTKFKFPVPCDYSKIENLAVTYCYLWLTEKLWLLGDTAAPPPEPPLKH